MLVHDLAQAADRAVPEVLKAHCLKSPDGTGKSNASEKAGIPEGFREGIMSEGTVIGAGLAGCEAAWALSVRGVEVTLCEMKPEKYSPAHKNPDFAELVCSNSLKAERIESAAGLLKAEMRCMGSLILDCAKTCAVPAGGALAVDRGAFAREVTRRILENGRIQVKTGEITRLPDGPAIVATGPLTSDALSAEIAVLTGQAHLSFFDAAAPIVEFESVDMEKAFFAARYGRGEADYINCPMNREEYERFWQALVSAEACASARGGQAYGYTRAASHRGSGLAR
jgi:methylenetetrahydrofolate--tRNA-(uracil-5-)-methyltransferase